MQVARGFDEVSFGIGGASRIADAVLLSNGSMRIDIFGTIGKPYHGLTAANPGLALTNWTVLGAATEVSPGFFQLFDSLPTVPQPRFYKVRSP